MTASKKINTNTPVRRYLSFTAFLCLNVVNIELSHYARVDATLCFVVLIAFYFVVKIHNADLGAMSKWYVLAGLFSGITFQNKLPAVILVIPFLVAHLFVPVFLYNLPDEL